MRRTIAQQLQAAKQALIKFGWIKNDFGNKETGFCMLGALGHVRAGSKAEATLQSVLPRQTNIAEYNDSEHRCRKHVFAAFDRAIIKSKNS
jgi:hypothetical protein